MYYIVCLNFFIKDFIERYGKKYDEEKDDYNVELYIVDIFEGKNDFIYNVYLYYIKVFYKVIMRYILYYIKFGDIVFDGFCGLGMIGVVVVMCENFDLEFKIVLEKEFE